MIHVFNLQFQQQYVLSSLWCVIETKHSKKTQRTAIKNKNKEKTTKKQKNNKKLPKGVERCRKKQMKKSVGETDTCPN